MLGYERRLLVGGWCACGGAPGVVQAAWQKVMPYLRLIGGGPVDESSGLEAIPAVPHVAPAPGAVGRRVDEREARIGAQLQAVPIAGREEGRERQGYLEGEQRRGRGIGREGEVWP